MPKRSHVLTCPNEVWSLQNSCAASQVLSNLLVVLHPNLQWCQTLCQLQGHSVTCSLVVIVSPIHRERVLKVLPNERLQKQVTAASWLYMCSHPLLRLTAKQLQDYSPLATCEQTGWSVRHDVWQHLLWFLHTHVDLRALHPSSSQETGQTQTHACLAAWQDVVQDHSAWMPVMQEVRKAAEERALATWQVAEGSHLWQLLTPLIPWRLERVNVSKQPKRKRAPSEIPFLHRGMCLLTPDNNL
eukprot:5981063-Amphidinium_carterae.1